MSVEHDDLGQTDETSTRNMPRADASNDEAARPANARAMSEYSIVQGGSAGKEVYTTPELRDIILRLLDKGTLATMLRLHKAGSSSVAGILYHTIHQSTVNKMSRANVSICLIVFLEHDPHVKR
jgi:hypothetical protein